MSETLSETTSEACKPAPKATPSAARYFPTRGRIQETRDVLRAQVHRRLARLGDPPAIDAAALRRPRVTEKTKRKAETAAFMPVAETPLERRCSW
jgi:hypothetical protein